MKGTLYLTGILLVFVFGRVSAQDTLTIHFGYDQATLLKSDKRKIDTMLERSVNGIRIIGHTDSDGDSGYNQQLGLNRARSVEQYIGAVSGNKDLIRIESKGENEPVDANNTPEGKAANRRAVVIFQYVDPVQPADESSSELIKKEDLKVGKKIVLENLNFYGGEAIIVPESKPTLAKLLKIMQDNPTLKIRLEGHVCCSPPGEDGLDYSTGLYNLSEARAAAVRQFLIDNGIDGGRMSSKGLKGDHRLIQLEQTEEDRLKNRRVEMVILSF